MVTPDHIHKLQRFPSHVPDGRVSATTILLKIVPKSKIWCMPDKKTLPPATRINGRQMVSSCKIRPSTFQCSLMATFPNTLTHAKKPKNIKGFPNDCYPQEPQMSSFVDITGRDWKKGKRGTLEEVKLLNLNTCLRRSRLGHRELSVMKLFPPKGGRLHSNTSR